MSSFYFDDEEEGLARETSHPFFVEHAAADFYYDCADDFSPFGNDSGNDTLQDLQGWYQQRHKGAKAVGFLRQLIENWDFDLAYLDITESAQFGAIVSENQYLTDSIDQAVIATAFGQYKIAGTGDESMVAVAQAAFRRQRYLAEKALARPDNFWEYAAGYLERLSTMETDFAIMANKKAR